MSQARRTIAFINAAHVLDHLAMLIFPTAVLGMGPSFGMDYGQLLPLATGAFIAFGAGSVPSGWLGDRWSRRNMLAVFFLGTGAAAILTGCATTPWQLAAGLTAIGLFASIYHPVGTALLVSHAERLGRTIGMNGVWGNIGVAGAALLTGMLVQLAGWRVAFVLPGAVAIAGGLVFLLLVPRTVDQARSTATRAQAAPPSRALVLRVFSVLTVVTLAGGVTFNASSVAMPKLFAERLPDLTGSTAGVGLLVALVFLFGAVAQLIVGRGIDRMSLRQVFVPLTVLQAPCFLLIAYAHGWALLLPAAGVMFALFGQVTVNDAMVARYTTERWRSRAFALRYLLSFGTSAVAVPLVAVLHDSGGGFLAVFQLLTLFGLAVFGAALFFPGRTAADEGLAPAPQP